MYGLSPNAMVALFVGAFNASNDLETLLKAARVIETSGDKNIQFVVAGDGDNSMGLRSLASGLTNVVFTGWQDQLSILALMRLASIGVAPYFPSALQSLPNKPFEYWAGGLPILSSLTGELEYLNRSEGVGLNYKAGDVLSLIEALRWYHMHPEERAAMGSRARALVQDQFNSDVIYPRLVVHLEDVARLAPQRSQYGQQLIEGCA